MNPRRPLVVPIVISLVLAAACARLGVWQLHRLAERRGWNARLEQRLADVPVAVTSLSPDTALGHYRRVSVRGVFDYAGEVALAGRSSQGSPGVHLLTPMRLPSSVRAMVNRGWVYAPDAMTVDAARWREHDGDTITIVGYAETWSGRETVAAHGARRVVRALDSSAVARFVGAPVLPYYLVQTSDSAPATGRPVRLGEPVLADGSHRGYAMQWFSFSLLAVVGGALLLREDRVRRRASA